MGQTYSNYYHSKEWYVYCRRIDTDEYENQPAQTWKNIDKKEAFNRFKHETYAYGLQCYEYNDIKAIYLYKGRKRKIRVACMNNQLVIESADDLEHFINATETLAPQRYPLLKDKFYKKYFKNYARLNTDKIGYVLNKIDNS